MCPRVYLRSGGILFIALTLLGSFGAFGPTAAKSIFGERWFLDATENLLHFALGTLFLSGGAAPPSVRRRVTLLFGWLLFAFTLYLILSRSGFAAHFEKPASVIFYFLMGIFALADGFCRDETEIVEEQKDTDWKL